MSSVAVEPLAATTPEAGDLTTRSVSGGRALRNRLATVAVWLAVLAAMVPLALVLGFVVVKGAGVISLDFVTKEIPTTRSSGPGMGPAIVGTLMITGAATVLAVPLGVLAAVYLNEYGAGNRLAGVLRLLADVMAGVPSIVMGLFVYTVWVLHFGLSAVAGSLALACLMLPIVIRSTEAMLRLVPRELREASYALGSTRSRTILTVVLPAALPGITSGCLLAVARAAGETAPLLFTIGAVQVFNPNLLHGANTALSAQIFANAQQPYPGAQDRAWGAALTLIALVVVLTLVARFVSNRLTVRGRG
jgi:phosphate transport system permease protein